MTRTIQKRKAGKAKMSDQGIGEALVFGFGILLCMKAGCVPKPCLQYCMRTESGVRYPSAEKLKEFSRRGIDHEPSRFSAISGHRVSKPRVREGVGSLFSQVTTSGRWRTFQVTTRVEVLKPSGATRVWVPAALISETPFQKTLANTFNCRGRYCEDGRKRARRARNHRRGISGRSRVRSSP